ncbi:hypothetical protein Vadar_029556 [Vaccinium darrowii]|uniref:Uncharacterized protein n=1 Tax=Vaccinium darrowii TaxID=229202 RepID=A0ACB7YGX1_9ERIC|nr:hypothetical protein Vadar_029556 [Vaccinium darrowii]
MQLHTKQQRIHYLGTLTNPLIGDVQHWEGQGFKLFFVGELQEDSVTCVMILPLHDYETFINNKYNDCSLDDLFKAFVCIFTSLLRYWRDFDRILALGILRQNIALVQQGELGTRKKPWTTIAAEERMESFILHQRNMEFVSDLIPGIAQSYFGGALPIMLAENEESVLLLMGLQGHAFGDVKVADD